MRNLRGWIPDVPDDRDILYTSMFRSASLPDSASVAHPDVAARDQWGTASCVGQALSQSIRLARYQDRVVVPPLSALFIYYNARKEDGNQLFDEGTTLRSAIRAVRKLGVCADAYWPCEESRVAVRPAWQAYRMAHDLGGIRGYYRVDNIADSVRHAIAAGKPVMGGWYVDEEFTSSLGPSLIDRPSGRLVGGHAMVLDGYNEDGTFNLLNSWGIDWRQEGRARVTEAFVEKALDLWAIDT